MTAGHGAVSNRLWTAGPKGCFGRACPPVGEGHVVRGRPALRQQMTKEVQIWAFFLVVALFGTGLGCMGGPGVEPPMESPPGYPGGTITPGRPVGGGTAQAGGGTAGSGGGAAFGGGAAGTGVPWDGEEGGATGGTGGEPALEPGEVTPPPPTPTLDTGPGTGGAAAAGGTGAAAGGTGAAAGGTGAAAGGTGGAAPGTAGSGATDAFAGDDAGVDEGVDEGAESSQ